MFWGLMGCVRAGKIHCARYLWCVFFPVFMLHVKSFSQKSVRRLIYPIQEIYFFFLSSFKSFYRILVQISQQRTKLLLFLFVKEEDDDSALAKYSWGAWPSAEGPGGQP